MKSLFSPRKAALAVAIIATFSLTACQTPASKVAAPAVSSAKATKPVDQTVTQRILGDGLYELAYSPATNTLYVASAQGFKDVNGGMLYRLDPTTLATKGETHTDLKNFGMAINDEGSVIYTTNSLDGAVSKVDAQSGKVLQRVMFGGKDKDGDAVGAREMLLHGDALYVGRVADPGYITVVNTKTFKVKTTIKNIGKWVTGIIYSPLTERIYAANGAGEIAVINPHTHKVEKRWSPNDGKDYLFLNMAEDPATGRLFVTDDSKGKTTLVFDEQTGKVIKRIEGDALGIKFNAKRNEIYISQRESKKVLQLDATTYAVKHSWSFDTNPNSLLVSADGQTLYVSLKQAFNKDNSTKGPDSVARISLK
ncbi:MAG: YncE family protein [Enterobacterales bacterium endosymbiont of Blomia tropicalis]|uniref:YncE family protein n=1 Tax=Mixta mediterraneensis TaxID=2758443 RepID=UPI0025A71D3F|nr:YncE family protein [Mixta mediterraneensis]MDL4915859.1 YncE family protein [Mixta mediterraneensis]